MSLKKKHQRTRSLQTTTLISIMETPLAKWTGATVLMIFQCLYLHKCLQIRNSMTIHSLLWSSRSGSMTILMIFYRLKSLFRDLGLKPLNCNNSKTTSHPRRWVSARSWSCFGRSRGRRSSGTQYWSFYCLRSYSKRTYSGWQNKSDNDWDFYDRKVY